MLLVNVRSIPASAGEPRHRVSELRTVFATLGVYPRVCGGTDKRRWIPAGALDIGLSPRLRGNHLILRGGRTVWTRSVYPRVCGGTGCCLHVPWLRCNRSIPASAGEPKSPIDVYHDASIYRRSIPASAGEPPRRTRTSWSVYPRPGEPSGSLTNGLSPRLRGNRPAGAVHPADARSIPASAGEPAAGDRWPGAPGVYPRVCGGTSVSASLLLLFNRVYPRVCGGTFPWPELVIGLNGLSPRLRGNLPALDVGPVRVRVYPRVCGGTPVRCGPNESMVVGLSPRLRGNPLRYDTRHWSL